MVMKHKWRGSVDLLSIRLTEHQANVLKVYHMSYADMYTYCMCYICFLNYHQSMLDHDPFNPNSPSRKGATFSIEQWEPHSFWRSIWIWKDSKKVKSTSSSQENPIARLSHMETLEHTHTHTLALFMTSINLCWWLVGTASM